MVMSAATSNPVQNHEINTAFERLVPELQSRAERLARRHRRDRQAAVSEVLSSMYFNFASAARKGRWLGPAALGWAAQWHLRFRSTFSREPRQQPTISIHDEEQTVGERLTTDDREDPAQRVRIKLDWDTIAARLPRRLQAVVRGLSAGFTKSQIARQLNVSPCRITQLLQKLAGEIEPYINI